MPFVPLRWAVLALASVSIKCGDATGPREVPLQFQEIGTTEDPIPVVADGGIGTIEVTGSIVTCDPLGAVAERRDGHITLEVGSSLPRRLCALVAQAVVYRATLIDLEPGFYRLTVLHAPSGASAERVLRDEVEVR